MRKLINRWVFQRIHGNTLVFNDCREDPRIDKVALELQPADRMLVITSAGCNSLDYVLEGVEHIYAVDINPRQNALLELKQAAIRALEFDDFFQWFGDGCHPRAIDIYRQSLREQLTSEARAFWDKKVKLFSPKNRAGSFYFSGPCGKFARLVNFYIDRIAKLRPHLDAMFSAEDLDQQREIYDKHGREAFWRGPIRWLINRDFSLALLGVPLAQRRQIERHYPGGVANFVQSAFETVFTEIPLHDNYLWHVYLYGGYSPTCCPEYLKPDNFARLKQGLVDRISVHTMSVAELLESERPSISKFVLLDHMDWFSGHDDPDLIREWQGIVDCATPDARLLWRSGGMRTDFVDEVEVTIGGEQQVVGDLLTYHRKLADDLHRRDRVQTYGSFFIADLHLTLGEPRSRRQHESSIDAG